MRRMAAISAILIPLLSCGSIVLAQAPKTSLRPVVREQVYPVALPRFAPEESLRPLERPGRLATSASKRPAAAAVSAAAKPKVQSANAPVKKAAPSEAPKGVTVKSGEPLPDSMVARAEPDAGTARGKTQKKPSNKLGKVCGSRGLIGQEVAPVAGSIKGCGIRDGAIRLHEVSGVKLSTPATMTCGTAKALQNWVGNGLERSVKNYGGGVVELKVAAGYACRTRNNRAGAKISEHGKGNAIDISGFTLQNGETISVLNDWGKGRKGRILRRAHGEACGPFGTVLGPKADRYHQDHFHFDIARHRGGAYCR